MRHARAFGYALARSLATMRRSPGGTAWVIGATALAFALLGLVALVTSNVDRLAARLGGAQMIVYLEDGISPARVDRIAAALARLPATEDPSHVSQDQALARMRATLGDDALLAGLETGVLPASIEVALAPGVRDVAAIHPVIARLEAIPGVDSVEVTGAWFERLAALRQGLERARWILLLLVGGACVYFVATAAGVRARFHRGESEVLDLLGASRAFVRGPLVIAGAVQGALGASLAVFGLWLLFFAGADALAEILAQVIDRAVAPRFLSPGHIAALIASGGLLGLVGTLVATRRYEMA